MGRSQRQFQICIINVWRGEMVMQRSKKLKTRNIKVEITQAHQLIDYKALGIKLNFFAMLQE